MTLRLPSLVLGFVEDAPGTLRLLSMRDQRGRFADLRLWREGEVVTVPLKR